VAIVGLALGINSIVQNSQGVHTVDNLISGEVPLVIVFCFHGVVLSLGFLSCIYSLYRAHLEYSSYSDLFRRLTRLNFMFLGCLLSLVLVIIVIIINASGRFTSAGDLLLALRTVFFVLPPLIIPPCVIWFFDPKKRVGRNREDITTISNEETKSNTGRFNRAESGTGGSFTAAKVSPVETPLEHPTDLPVVVRTESQANISSLNDGVIVCSPKDPDAVV